MDSGDAQGARMWALVGEKAGDNAQVLALAQAVGIPFEEKRIRYNGRRVLPNWLLGATLTTTSAASRPQIAPPWPDIVVASGQRSVGLNVVAELDDLDLEAVLLGNLFHLLKNLRVGAAGHAHLDGLVLGHGA